MENNNAFPVFSSDHLHGAPLHVRANCHNLTFVRCCPPAHCHGIGPGTNNILLGYSMLQGMVMNLEANHEAPYYV